MKTIKLLSLFLLSCIAVFAQSPEELNYQGVARNSSGQPIANQSITLRLSIRNNSATGAVQYRERHNVTTNDYGLYNVGIGTGTQETGSMAGVTWSSGSKYLQVQIDPNGGTSYTNLGAEKLLSVPYALYAASGNQGPAGPAGVAGPQGVPGPAGPAGSANISGTNNRLVKFTSANTGGNSIVSDNGNQVLINNATNNDGVLRVSNTSTTGNARHAVEAILGSGYSGNTTTPSAMYVHGGTIGIGMHVYSRASHALFANTDVTGASALYGLAQNNANGVHGEAFGTGNAILGLMNGSSATGWAGYFNGGTVGKGIRSLSTTSADGAAGYFTSNTSSFIGGGIVRVEYLGSLAGDHRGLVSRVVVGSGLNFGIGIRGEGGYRGVQGIIDRTTTGTGTGVYGLGRNNGSVYGVRGLAYKKSGANAGTKYGIYGIATGGTTNYAGYFSGNVNVTGNLSKGGGTFKIDHPKDPENKYLYHSFVESPDMMNIYNGNITTNASGEAVVTMPDYFDALNIDFRYQLTPIGQFAQAIVLTEISGNTFSIKTDKPNVKVSWQVTGVRNDNWAKAHRVVPEVEKEEENKGLYLHAEEFGQEKEKSIDWNTHEKPMLEREGQDNH